jgi:negative regulator of sigma E activity
MNEALKMQISAFVDGELPDNESEFLLRRLSQDASMRQQVAEYLEIGRLIRRDQDVPGVSQLRGRISAALGEEAIPDPQTEAVVGSRFISPASGIAIAATVAVVALLGLNQLGVPVDSGVQDAVAIDLAPAYTEPSLEQVLMNSPSERQLDYLRRHGDSSPSLGSSDIIYRMATFEVSENLEVIEPDGHLVSTGREGDAVGTGTANESRQR